MGRFTLVHLLLLLVLVNLGMITLFVLAISGNDSGMVRSFGTLIGADSGSSWSNYLFLTMLLFVNATPILVAALMILFPVLQEGVIVSHRALDKVLRSSPRIDEDARAQVIDGLYSEAAHTRGNRLNAEFIFAIGGVLFFLTFPLFCFTFAQTFPQGTALFVANGVPVSNAQVTLLSALLFTIDQVATVFLLDGLDIFGLSFAQAQANPANPGFGLFVLCYRIAFALILFAGLALLLKRLFQLFFWRGYTHHGKAADAAAET